MATIRVGIIGDYDARPTHLATDAALKHGAAVLDASVESTWLTTDSLAGSDSYLLMRDYDAFWCAPGSPYQSMSGALTAIRQAREGEKPFIGTCGGFQHVVLEYARNVLGLVDASHAEYDPDVADPFITPLSCSPFGRIMRVKLEPDSKVSQHYGATTVQEQHRCNFGVDKARQRLLHEGGLRVVGTIEDGEARVVELPDHTFFIATLFVPQLTSTPERPHPLIVAYLRAALATRAGVALRGASAEASGS